MIEAQLNSNTITNVSNTPIKKTIIIRLNIKVKIIYCLTTDILKMVT